MAATAPESAAMPASVLASCGVGVTGTGREEEKEAARARTAWRSEEERRFVVARKAAATSTACASGAASTQIVAPLAGRWRPRPHSVYVSPTSRKNDLEGKELGETRECMALPNSSSLVTAGAYLAAAASRCKHTM